MVGRWLKRIFWIVVLAGVASAVDLAEARIRQARSQLEFAPSELERAESLIERNVIAEAVHDRKKMDVATAEAEVASAIATLEVRKRELESARARLIGPENPDDSGSEAESCCIEVHTPVSGKVLRIISESEQVVAAGTPPLEIGDPVDLETTRRPSLSRCRQGTRERYCQGHRLGR